MVWGKILCQYFNSSFGMYGYNGTVTLNAINEDYHTGGSSSGSAVSVKSFQSLG